MDKLLPCPFCGGLPAFGVIDTEDDPNQGGHFIACGNPQCDATTGLVFACMDGPEQVLTEKWNRRTQAPADPEHPAHCKGYGVRRLHGRGDMVVEPASARNPAV